MKAFVEATSRPTIRAEIRLADWPVSKPYVPISSPVVLAPGTLERFERAGIGRVSWALGGRTVGCAWMRRCNGTLSSCPALETATGEVHMEGRRQFPAEPGRRTVAFRDLPEVAFEVRPADLARLGSRVLIDEIAIRDERPARRLAEQVLCDGLCSGQRRLEDGDLFGGRDPHPGRSAAFVRTVGVLVPPAGLVHVLRARVLADETCRFVDRFGRRGARAPQQLRDRPEADADPTEVSHHGDDEPVREAALGDERRDRSLDARSEAESADMVWQHGAIHRAAGRAPDRVEPVLLDEGRDRRHLDDLMAQRERVLAFEPNAAAATDLRLVVRDGRALIRCVELAGMKLVPGLPAPALVAVASVARVSAPRVGRAMAVSTSCETWCSVVPSPRRAAARAVRSLGPSEQAGAGPSRALPGARVARGPVSPRSC